MCPFSFSNKYIVLIPTVYWKGIRLVVYLFIVSSFYINTRHIYRYDSVHA